MTGRDDYLNPVYPRDFPDPFVLKHCGEYWAYCTGYQADGRVFGVMRSRDLVHWREIGGAMDPLPGEYPCYWAPEVTYDDGRFYLYYSVGDEATMHIRVATADDPAGPFIDQGARLTREPFAIDAHVFTAPDGRRLLFYATDFLEHERIGTGTVVDQLRDPFTLAGRPRPVSRPRHDWQIYDPQRAEKGGVRWHTIEGPFVLARKGVYYQMFSGGNWQNPSYGVSYATTRNLDEPGEWDQLCDGEQVLPILRTIPGQVIGPGHNSVVRGPDNRQLYCVYHRWGEGNGRQLAIDPLDWAGDRLLVLGPSYTPQTAPNRPTWADFFDGPKLSTLWIARGAWRVAHGVATAEPDGEDTAALSLAIGDVPFMVEVSGRAATAGKGGYGLSLRRGGSDLLRLQLSASGARLLGPDGATEALPLPPGFRADAFHLLRVELDSGRVVISVDERPALTRELAAVPAEIALFAAGQPAAFAGFGLTIGWQDDFDAGDGQPGRAWTGDRDRWAVRGQELVFDGPGEGRLWRGPRLRAYELVIGVRLHNEDGAYGIAAAIAADGGGPLLVVERVVEGWRLRVRDGDAIHDFQLPPAFDPTVYQHFRLRKDAGRLSVYWEAREIAILTVSETATEVGLYARGAAAFDMARLTALNEDESIADIASQVRL